MRLADWPYITELNILPRHFQSYFVIKAAQEKESLQREGDDLDAKIKKAEKEIRALENTLRLLNARNETYRLEC